MDSDSESSCGSLTGPGRQDGVSAPCPRRVDRTVTRAGVTIAGDPPAGHLHRCRPVEVTVME